MSSMKQISSNSIFGEPSDTLGKDELTALDIYFVDKKYPFDFD